MILPTGVFICYSFGKIAGGIMAADNLYYFPTILLPDLSLLRLHAWILGKPETARHRPAMLDMTVIGISWYVFYLMAVSQ